jgi:hypothetical protein
MPFILFVKKNVELHIFTTSNLNVPLSSVRVVDFAQERPRLEPDVTDSPNYHRLSYFTRVLACVLACSTGPTISGI